MAKTYQLSYATPASFEGDPIANVDPIGGRAHLARPHVALVLFALQAGFLDPFVWPAFFPQS